MSKSIPAIVTFCERQESYAISTLTSLQQAGFHDINTFYDGDATADHAHLARVMYSGSSGVRTGIVPAFRMSLARILNSTKVSEYAIFQDDIILSLGLHDWLIDNAPEGVVSLYTPFAHDAADGWNEYDLVPSADDRHPWMNSMGACGYLLPRFVVEGLLQMPPPFRTDRLGSWIAEWCYHNDVPYWMHSPSLVQHVGKYSVRSGLPFNEERQAKRFCEDVSSI